MLALFVAYVSIVACLNYSLPFELLIAASFFSLLIPFMLVIMLLTDNPLYEALKSKQWFNVAILSVLGVYSSFSYIWASSEVNSIFKVSPGNLPWSIIIVTIVYFFKNIILVSALIAFIFSLLYSTVWLVRVLVTNYNGFSKFIKSVLAGVTFILGIGLLIGSSVIITVNKQKFAKIIAVKADFNIAHHCKGELFENSSGVLFLPKGSVLVAIPYFNGTQLDWLFRETTCNS